MNGIHLDIPKITNTDPDNNVFELRRKVYKDLVSKVCKHIDYLYDKLIDDNRKDEIADRSIKNQIDKESLIMLYKGIEIPMLDKTCIILDNIEYIPIFQMIDRPIHLQKDNRFVVIKNNIRNTYLKLDGTTCNVLYKNARIPLLPYLLYIYPKVKDMLVDLGYTIVDKDHLDLKNKTYYFVPEYYDNSFIIVEKNFGDRCWKDYFLSPYIQDNFEFHQAVCNRIIDQINNDIIPEVLEDGVPDPNALKDIKNKSSIDDVLEEKKKKNSSIDEKHMREYTLLPHKTDQETLDKIYTIINSYHEYTRSVKKNITKIYLETSLFKYMCKDITMDNISIFGMIIENVKKNSDIPKSYNIADISQKNLRFMEWYAMKLSSVRSYPEQALITEVAKTEQKRIYNNAVNPITELGVMTRVNLFGPGALPIEACNTLIRNLNDSYFGIVDPIDSPAGKNIGISLHLTPEVKSMDLHVESEELAEHHIFNRLYEMQDKGETVYGESDK